jgi:hypothetical protein
VGRPGAERRSAGIGNHAEARMVRLRLRQRRRHEAGEDRCRYQDARHSHHSLTGVESSGPHPMHLIENMARPGRTADLQIRRFGRE